MRRMSCATWWRRNRGRSRNESCAGFDISAPGCESVRAATLGELWNEATNGIASRLPGARNMMDSKGLARWRGLVCVTPEKFSGCAKRPPKGVSPKKIAPAAVGNGRVMVCGSIFVRHHQGDGGLRVVNVQRAARRNQLHKPRCAVVIADIERNRDAVATWAAA